MSAEDYESREMIAWAKQITNELRKGSAPEWTLIRQYLHGVGVDPDDAAIGDFGPDGQAGAGLIVTRDGRIFEFSP
jgi:hypothetical protein